MNSNFRSLYYFIVAAEEMNITKAARKLFMSQQSLSKHIQKLESSYDTTLFTRSPHLRLTWEGERMLEYAKKTIALENGLIDNLRDKEHINRVKLPIGVVSARAKVFLPEIFAAYHKMHPNVILSIVPCNHRTSDTMLRTGAIDLYFSVTDSAGRYGKLVKTIPDELFFIVSRELLKQVLPDSWEKFAKKQKTGIELPDTFRFPMILPDSESTLRLLLDRYFNNSGYMPVTVAETNEIDIISGLCAQGDGAAFFSKPHVYTLRYELMNQPIMVFPVRNVMGLSSLDITYNESENLPRHITEFIECSKKIIENMSLMMDDYIRSRPIVI